MECKPLFSKELESYTQSNKYYSDWIRHSIPQSNSLFTTNMGLTLHFTLNHFSLLFAFNQLERAKLASVCKYAKRSLRLARLCQVVSVCYCTRVQCLYKSVCTPSRSDSLSPVTSRVPPSQLCIKAPHPSSSTHPHPAAL